MLLKCKRGFEDFSTFGAFLTVCHCYGVHIGFVFQHPYLCHKRFSAQIIKNYPEWFWKRCFSISRGQRGPKGSIVGCMSYFHVILQSCLCVVLFMARGAGKLLGFFMCNVRLFFRLFFLLHFTQGAPPPSHNLLWRAGTSYWILL